MTTAPVRIIKRMRWKAGPECEGGRPGRRGALRPPGIQNEEVKRRRPPMAALMVQPHQTPMMPCSLARRSLPSATRLVTSLPQGLGPSMAW